MLSPPESSPRWQPFLGHALTVFALSLGGLSSFYALKTEVVELRATVGALIQTEAEHSRRNEAALRDASQRHDSDLRQLRSEVKELHTEVRGLRTDLHNPTRKGADTP